MASALDNIVVWNGTGSGAVSIADAMDATKGVAVVIPPQTTSATSGSEAKVAVTVNSLSAKADFKNITFDPGKVYTYKLNLKASTLSIELISIQDWVSGGSATTLTLDTWS